MTYKITIKKSARKEISKLAPPIAARVLSAIYRLADNPRGPNTRQMVGVKNWRLRAGDYRVIYTIYDSRVTVEIVRVRHRSKAYKR